MAVILTAPISEAEYRTYQLLKLPSDFTGDPVTTLLNQAWQMITTWAKQPLTKTTNTDLYQFPSRYANLQPSGYFKVTPRYLPIITVASASWSLRVESDGWNASLHYDIMNDSIYIYDFPFARGDFGQVKLVYDSGYTVVPDDLRMACALMTAHLLSGGYFPTQSGTSVLPGWLPKDVERIVTFYKRVR